MFAAEIFGIRPDMMTVAKGLTSGYVPMSASIFSQELWQVLLEGHKTLGVFGHGYTYSAHPLAAAAGLANLDILIRENLVQNSATVGAYLQRRVREELADHPLVGDVRGIGLLAGIELADKSVGEPRPFEPRGRMGKRFSAACYKNGLIGRLLMDSDIFALAPPLIVTTEDVDAMVGILKRSLDEVAREP
jgi:L-2,4-diaminobutyrate transaminase